MIDIDRSGTLSYEEVFDLSRISLLRSFNGDEGEEVLECIEGMAKYFADMIFQLTRVDKEQEITLEKLRDVKH